MLFKGKVAIVSGVGTGLGGETALLLAREGADVVLGARTQAKLEDYARQIEAMGRRALVVPTDVTKEDDARNVADKAIDHFARIDVLINNAGWTGAYEPLVETPVAEWQANADGNLVGPMAMCKYTARHMITAKRGAIVNVTTLNMRQGIARRSSYGAAKAGITVMTQSLAAELGSYGIRVNCVAPGHIWSSKLQNFYQERAEMLGKSYDEVHRAYTGTMALRKIANPAEIARAIVFMASDLASGITGQSLDVNAGQHYH